MAKQKKQQKLTLTHIQSSDTKFDSLTRVTFDNGMYTEIYPHFRPSTIDSMLESFANFLVEYEKMFGSFDENKIIDYLNLHILITFSTLVEEMPKSIEEKVIIFKQILDNEYAEKIFESFDKKEVSKVFNRMWKKLDAYQEILKTNQEMREKLKQHIANSNLQNKEIIESMLDLGDDNGEANNIK